MTSCTFLFVDDKNLVLLLLHSFYYFVTHITVNRVTHHNNLVIGDSCCFCVCTYVCLLVPCCVISILGIRCRRRPEINEMILKIPILWWQPLYILLFLHINRDQKMQINTIVIKKDMFCITDYIVSRECRQIIHSWQIWMKPTYF